RLMSLNWAEARFRFLNTEPGTLDWVRLTFSAIWVSSMGWGGCFVGRGLFPTGLRRMSGVKPDLHIQFPYFRSSALPRFVWSCGSAFMTARRDRPCRGDRACRG